MRWRDVRKGKKPKLGQEVVIYFNKTFCLGQIIKHPAYEELVFQELAHHADYCYIFQQKIDFNLWLLLDRPKCKESHPKVSGKVDPD